MRYIVGVVVLVGVGMCAWIVFGFWRWDNTNFAELFKTHIGEEAGTDDHLVFPLDSAIAVGSLGATKRLVCGDVSVRHGNAPAEQKTFSFYVVKTLFGTYVNDGFTPATRAENEAISVESCTNLRAHLSRPAR